MKNIKDIVIGICAIIGFTAILTGFTNEETSIVQQYEFEIVTVVESVVPKGLGRSRMLAKTEIVDYNPSTSVRMEDGEKVKSKNDKRKDIRTKAFEETKLLNFYNLGGIRFNNIATNDAMVKSKLNQMTAEGWELTFVTGGVESSGDKDPNGIYLSRYIFKKPL
jgi:hypothetical protein|tara:strand:+ start:6913 stop:7404 length:492 start_codon:yes stop_codon:yes gene_type:complete